MSQQRRDDIKQIPPTDTERSRVLLQLYQAYVRDAKNDLTRIVTDANKGNIHAQIFLEGRYLKGINHTDDGNKRCLAALTFANDKGHPKAAFYLAQYYLSSIGMPITSASIRHLSHLDLAGGDPSRATHAINFLNRAARNGDVDALVSLGKFHEEDLVVSGQTIVEGNKKQALAFYCHAAAAGSKEGKASYAKLLGKNISEIHALFPQTFFNGQLQPAGDSREAAQTPRDACLVMR